MDCLRAVRSIVPVFVLGSSGTNFRTVDFLMCAVFGVIAKDE